MDDLGHSTSRKVCGDVQSPWAGAVFSLCVLSLLLLYPDPLVCEDKDDNIAQGKLLQRRLQPPSPNSTFGDRGSSHPSGQAEVHEHQ